jgi:hypothetical protein
MNKFKLLNAETRITKIIDVEVDNGFGLHKSKMYKSYDLEGNPIPGLKIEVDKGVLLDADSEFDMFFTEWIKDNVK